MDVIRRGGRGEAVRDVQHRLLAAGLRVSGDELDGTFGASTEEAVREFQRRRGLPSDGLVGADTWSQLVESGYRLGDRTLYLRSPAFRGDDVRELQRMLNALGFDAGKQDGIFGPRVTHALMEFQGNSGAKVDGIVGLDTVRSLEGMRPTLEGPSRAVVREEEAARTMVASLAGSVVAVEAGADEGGDRIAAQIADALVVELEHRGARPLLLSADADADADVSARAKRANANEAIVCVSVGVGSGEPVAAGAACFFYGTPQTHSPMGKRLAECILAALARNAGLKDGGTHARSIAILRETRMPAVRVEPAVATNADEAEAVTQPGFAARVAVAIADGVDAFFGPAVPGGD